MPSQLPDGDPAPADGRLPAVALESLGSRAFGMYVHVPFCATRCGYCDFNTYTAPELGLVADTAAASYADQILTELALARRVLGGPVEVDTVFFGGGTPTLLPPEDLVRILDGIDTHLGLAVGVEVTTEANPDSVNASDLQRLRDGGFTRISFGMQSAVSHVLRVLDRTHDPDRIPQVVEWARCAGFEQLSLDLIYGTPGETLQDWRTSLDAALACAPDHLSAYALIVEDGTALARQVRQGLLPAPDDDDLADKYLLADELLAAAGMGWYEVSNWATGPDQWCRHNLGYWRGDNWWGAGPGAHSHVGGVRWWNVKHPNAYADRIAAGQSPALARETLDEATQRLERVLLETRLVEGLPRDVLDAGGRAALPALEQQNLVQAPADRVVLTTGGRLLADAVVRDLLA